MYKASLPTVYIKQTVGLYTPNLSVDRFCRCNRRYRGRITDIHSSRSSVKLIHFLPNMQVSILDGRYTAN